MSTLLAPWSELASGTAAGNTNQLERLTLSARQTREECWLDYRYTDALGDTRALSAAQSLRFLLSPGERIITIAPQLANRPVVARPLVPTALLPKERSTLFVSTVLWARVQVGEQLLAEFPTVRLSDTWFGANTRHGELCYASQTRALLRLDNAQHTPFRAITPITINNQGDDNIKLERINVPVPHLTLYCDGERFLTSALSVLLEKNLVTAKLHIDPTPPPNAFIVAQPRKPIRGGVFDRAVDLLFA